MTKVYLILAAAFFAQYKAHRLDTVIDGHLRNGWNQMMKYTIGVGVTAPFFDALMWAFNIPEKIRRQVILLYFAAFFSGGMGTLAGWFKFPTPPLNHNGGNGK